MKALAIIQSRLGSSRLRGKALLPLAGRPLTELVIRAVQAASLVGEVVLAVPESDLESFRPLARKTGCQLFGGSELDVLNRYAQASRLFSYETLVRATGDNPFVCPEKIDEILSFHHENRADLSHWLGIPLGTGVEVIRREALLEADQKAERAHEREHVTPWIYQNRDHLRVFEPDLKLDPGLRLTVDTLKDYQRAERFAEYCAKNDLFPVRLGEILALFKSKPEIFA